MRRALQGLLAAGLMVSAAGCDDFLTPEPRTFSSSNNFYQTPAHFEGAVTTLYGDLRGLFSGNFRTLGDLRGETVSLQFNINVPGFTFQLDEFSEATNDNTVQPQYGSIFNTIFDANVILTRIENVTFTDQAQKSRIIAEAKFIRALAMWQGLQYFGLGESWQPGNLAIPLILTEITDPQEAFNLERATVQQVYDQIIADLKESIPNLPVRGSAGATGANLGRVTRGAAEFLLGATYQLNTPSQEAQNLALAEFRKLAGEGYRLVTTGSGGNNAYRQVFNPAAKNNIESILEIQYLVSSENGDLRQNLVGGMSPLNAIGGGNAGRATTIPVYGATGGGSFMPTQNHILSFAGADPSQPVTPFDLRYEGGYGQFCPGSVSGVLGVRDSLGVGTDPTLVGRNELFPELNMPSVRDPVSKAVRTNCIPYFTKWRWPEAMPQAGRDNNNTIVFRYADALLRIAESAVRVGNQAEAAAALNEVRRRAGLPDDAGTVTPADVLQERAWELAGEGWRWFDLKRFGVASSTIQAHGNFRRSIIPRQAAQQDIYMARGDFYRLRYPIRPRDVDLSQCKIKQNPGWTNNAECVGT